MDSRRQLKVASLFKEAITEILIREGRKIYGQAFVTVSNVTINSDLTLVRFYLSIYNTTEPDAVVERFNEHKFELKRALAEKLRNHVRRIPEIDFFKDETMEYVFHMQDVFKRIKDEDNALKEELENKKAAKPRAKKAAATKGKSKPKP